MKNQLIGLAILVLCFAFIYATLSFPRDPKLGSVWCQYDDNPFHKMVGTDSVLEVRHEDWAHQDQWTRYVNLVTMKEETTYYFTAGRRQVR
jgi:hypothetical protein